jgi:hypothetical protein
VLQGPSADTLEALNPVFSRTFPISSFADQTFMFG